MFIIALLKIEKKWEKTKCSSADVWVTKMQYMHRTDYLAVSSKKF